MGNLCPMCKKHPKIVIEQEDTTLVADTIVTYTERVLYCPNFNGPGCGEYFYTADAMNENLKRIKMAYKEKMNERT